MPYYVPNAPDVPHVDLAEPDNGDYLALGYHRTGVVSGGTVAQSGSPNMTVQVATAEIVIDGVPILKGSGPVTLDSSTSDPRFDLVGWYITGGPVAIKGTPGTNPSLPVYDPTLFCLTASVYITAGAISITTPFITQKQVAPIRSLRRNYTAENDIVLEWATPLKANAFRALANGALSWASSLLSSTAETAMEWVTSLTIRQTAAAEKALVLKAASGAVKGNNILEVQSASASTAIAGMDSIGRIFGHNFRLGTGTPEGVVLADKGTLYLNEDPTDGTSALFVKTTNTVNTGWVALAPYVPASQTIPVGGVIMWPGLIGTDPIPVGYLYCDGSEQATVTYPVLSAWCGTKFGTASAGNFKLPDYRGRTPFGVDGVLATVSGVNIGAATVTLTTDQLPPHIHEVVEVEHEHPKGGPPSFEVDQTYRPPYHMPHNPGHGAGMSLEKRHHGHAAKTGVTIQPAGGGQPFSNYQPSQSTLFLIKT